MNQDMMEALQAQKENRTGKFSALPKRQILL